MAAFARPPTTAKTQSTPFIASTPESDLNEFRVLLKLSKIGKETYENTQKDRKYGITSDWLAKAKTQWEKFNWRKVEDDINSFPNYTTMIEESGDTFDIHFVALFSERIDATPILMLHRWPGSFLEFLPILKLLKAKYTPQTLPYHIVVPSLPGYAYLSPPPLHRDFKLENCAEIMDKLMVDLGFSDGYVVQGGDVGSTVARILGAVQPRARAVHLNFCIIPDPGHVPEADISEAEKAGLLRGQKFLRLDSSYALQHATKPGTTGLALATNPVALLAWIGEKYLDWTDEDPPLDAVLASVTLYWLTGCYPTSLWPYREMIGPGAAVSLHANSAWRVEKPLGYSWFPKELAPTPRAWVATTTGNLVFSRQHESGGHFAAMERPEVLLEDVEDFVAQVWPRPTAGYM